MWHVWKKPRCIQDECEKWEQNTNKNTYKYLFSFGEIIFFSSSLYLSHSSSLVRVFFSFVIVHVALGSRFCVACLAALFQQHWYHVVDDKNISTLYFYVSSLLPQVMRVGMAERAKFSCMHCTLYCSVLCRIEMLCWYSVVCITRMRSTLVSIN